MSGTRGHPALAGENEHVKILRDGFPNEADAKHAMGAELACVRRGAATFTLDLTIGHTDVLPEISAKPACSSDTITAYGWIVSKYDYRLSQ